MTAFFLAAKMEEHDPPEVGHIDYIIQDLGWVMGRVMGRVMGSLLGLVLGLILCIDVGRLA